MRLERAKEDALRMLADNGLGSEMLLRPYEAHIWLGVGYCVAKGWATYRGDDHYSITQAGLAEYKEQQAAER